MTTLEDFRQNDLGYKICFISYEKHCIGIPFTYNDYFNTTIYSFIKELNTFENSKITPVAYNASLLSIFTNLFSLMEQFITSVYIITYYSCKNNQINDKKTSDKLFRIDYKKIIKAIFQTINVNDNEFKYAKMYNKLQELEDIRNYILHGNMDSIKIEKTHLPQYPLTINYEDIMEELDIIINLMNHFRYIIPNIDFMPNIGIQINQSIKHKKLDDYFYNVLKHYVDNILQKHSLTPTKKYNLILKPLDTTKNTIIKNVEIRINPIQKIDYNMNIENTNLYKNYLKNIFTKDEILETLSSDTIQFPNFTKNT